MVEDSNYGVKDPDTSLLFIVSTLEPGGSEKKTVMIVNRLAEIGYDVSLVYLNEPEYLLGAVSDKVRVLKLNRKGTFDRKALMKLRGFIADNFITHIVAINLYPMLYAFLATRLSRREVIVMASINTTRFCDTKSKLKMVIYLPIIYQLNHIIFGCQYQRNLWSNKYLIPKRKSTVIYNGVDTTFYSVTQTQESIKTTRNRLGIHDSELVIGTVARLMKEKGHWYALHCMKNLIDQGINLKYILVGDGRLRNEYVKLVSDLGISESIIFVGNQGDVRAYLGVMDIFILTSVAVETFSNAALEAMSMSRAVIMTDISGASEMIRSGYNGLLIKPGNADGLAEAIMSLQDKERRKMLSDNARQRVMSDFSVEQMIENYIKLFNSI